MRKGNSPPHEVSILLVMIPLLFCQFVGSVGLLFLKKWAAWLYLISLINGFFLFPFLGPTVEHAVADTMDGISILLSGLIIGLAFFSGALRGGSAPPPGGPVATVGHSIPGGPPSVN